MFEFHHYNLWGNQKPQLSGQRATVERNGVKFGPRGEYLVYTGYF